MAVLGVKKMISNTRCVEVVSASLSLCHANVPGVSGLKAAFRLTTVLVRGNELESETWSHQTQHQFACSQMNVVKPIMHLQPGSKSHRPVMRWCCVFLCHQLHCHPIIS